MFASLIMTMKTYRGHCVGSNDGTPALHDVLVEAINPVQARKFLEARYPGYRQYYTSSQVQRPAKACQSVPRRPYTQSNPNK